MRQYCGYQERCHQDGREKLFSLGVNRDLHDEILATLIEEGYLNEERFAIAFAGGKFRIKEWGKIKIRYELKQRMVSDYCIKKALDQINDEEYERILLKTARGKLQILKEPEPLLKKKKLLDYLATRGFESAWANRAATELL